MKRPVFHMTWTFNLFGYSTPFGGKPQGFWLDFRPANREAWALLVAVAVLILFCWLGLPLLVGEEFSVDGDIIPTGIAGLIASVVVGLSAIFLFSETPHEDD